MAATYTLISSQVLGGLARDVTFSSIPSTYTDLLCTFSARTVFASAIDSLVFSVNGDTAWSGAQITCNYNGTTPNFMNYSSWYAYTTANQTLGNANFFGSGQIYIPNYAGSAAKQFFCSYAAENNSTSNGGLVGINGTLDTTTSAVSSINFHGAGDSFNVGSSFYIYGIKNA
jgi:hypothetical protein